MTNEERKSLTSVSSPGIGADVDGEAHEVGEETPTSADGIPNSNVFAQAHMARKEDRRTFKKGRVCCFLELDVVLRLSISR